MNPRTFDLTDLDNYANGFPHDVFTRGAPRVPRVLASRRPSTRPTARASGSSPATRTYVRAPRPGSRSRPRPAGPGPSAVRRSRTCRSPGRPEHDGRPAPPADPPAGEPRLHAPDDRPARGRAAPPDPRHPRARPRRRRCDLLVDVARELPLQAIAMLMGVPQDDREQLCEWVDVTNDLADRGPHRAHRPSREAGASLQRYGATLIEDKRRCPADDMVSLVSAATLPDEDPSQLTEDRAPPRSSASCSPPGARRRARRSAVGCSR